MRKIIYSVIAAIFIAAVGSGQTVYTPPPLLPCGTEGVPKVPCWDQKTRMVIETDSPPGASTVALSPVDVNPVTMPKLNPHPAANAGPSCSNQPGMPNCHQCRRTPVPQWHDRGRVDRRHWARARCGRQRWAVRIPGLLRPRSSRHQDQIQAAATSKARRQRRSPHHREQERQLRARNRRCPEGVPMSEALGPALPTAA
jgi:hypothetical protein